MNTLISKKIFSLLSTLMIAGLVLVGTTLFVKAPVYGATPIENYDLVVIEEEMLPAAAAPEMDGSGAVKWVISIVLITAALIAYEIWYESVRTRVQELAYTSQRSREMAESASRFHPFRLLSLRKDLEMFAAERYFYVR